MVTEGERVEAMDEKNNTAIPMQIGMAAQREAECNLKAMADPEPSLRSRLESRRNRLAQQLAEVDAALQALYVQPEISETVYRMIRKFA